MSHHDTQTPAQQAAPEGPRPHTPEMQQNRELIPPTEEVSRRNDVSPADLCNEVFMDYQ